MKAVLLLGLLGSLGLFGLAGCEGLPRDGGCVAADVCDQSLAEPFNSFSAKNPQFGDTGSCWQNAGTAAPCIEACGDFVAQNAAAARAANNRAVLAACGG